MNYLRTGQAARELGVSAHIIRKLCVAGLIEAEQTARGGQLRIPLHEVERLKEEGLPPIPQGLDERHGPAISRDRSGSLDATSGRQRSDRVQVSADDVDVVRNQLEKRRIEKEGAVVEDFFTERERERRRRQAERERQAAAAAAARERRDWLDCQVEIAFAMLPRDAPEELKLDVRETVLEALAEVRPDDSTAVTRELVQAAVSKTLRPYRRAQESQRAVVEAVEELPFSAKNLASPSRWQLEARQAAERAIADLPSGASYEQKRASVSQAVATISQRYECHEEAERHQQLCEKIANGWAINFEIKSEDYDEARDAIRRGLAPLPVGTSQRQLEAVKDRVLEPFKLRKLREELAQPGRGSLGWEAKAADYEDFEKQIAAKFAVLPEDADRTQLESVRQKVLKKVQGRIQERKRRDERSRAVAFKARQAVLHVDRYLREAYEFDSFLERDRTTRELREEIEPRLVDQLLESDMEAEELETFIEDFVDDSLEPSKEPALR